MPMSLKRKIFLAAAIALSTAAIAFPEHERTSRSGRDPRYDEAPARSGYSYVREVVGGVTVVSRLNGRVQARRNMPVSAGDEILVSDAGRAEIGLADGNLLFVGGGTRARFSSLYAQQGEDDDFSAIDLRDGSVILAAMGGEEGAIPRIDTEDATVYLSAGARARVNADPRRGTVVVVRAGSVEVRTRADTYTLRAGQYMMARADEDPEIERGVFSRDRFDLWAADRIEELYDESARSASVRYVDDDYASDVVALDDYGDWEYSSSYSTHVWSPRVAAGWSPYSFGSWYYTPIGLTWWSYDPWGWFPYHYGSWYFDAGWGRWCWVPSYVYSPAWVYWAYTPRYVGWCPFGYFSFYSPWFDNYYRRWGWSPGYDRSALYFAINGTFKTAQVDLGGWNFAETNGFGAISSRLDILSGAKLAGRLGEEIAVSSKPILVSARGDSIQDALREHVRQAPGLIERAKGRDASRLAPVLAREKSLPSGTLEALQDRAVVAGKGRLAGPGAEEISSRGAVVERGRSVRELLGRGGENRGLEKGSAEKGRVLERREAPRKEAPGPAAIEPRESKQRGRPAPVAQIEEWRGRAPSARREAVAAPPDRPSGRAPVELQRERTGKELSRGDDWRRRREAPRPKIEREAAPESRAPEAWRSRQDVPPAKRVIEGAVPGRRWQDESGGLSRGKEAARESQWRQSRERGPDIAQPREYKAPAPRQDRPAPREYRPEPREYKAPPREYRPEPREHRAPPPRGGMESRPAPAPAAPPRIDSGGFKGHGKGHKG